MEKEKLTERIKETIKKHSMFGEGEKVLIGLSGGPDSVCLLHVLNLLKPECRLSLAAVYVDHNLRPDETPGEIAFCRQLCDQLHIDFILKSVDVKAHAKEKGLNKQEAARELRFRMFDEAARETGAGRIALAHHADDQAETILMRLLRGAGPQGLSGIPARRGNIIRPLLEVEKAHIDAYLDSKKIPFVTDSSNLKTDYLRNSLRLAVIPELRKINPKLTSSIASTAAILQEEERYFGIIVTKTLMKMISRKTAHRIELFLSPMENMDRVILRRVLRRAVAETEGLRGIGFVHIEDIMHLVRYGSAGDRIYLPKGIRVIKEYSLLIITSERPIRIASYILQPPGEVAIIGAGLVMKASTGEMPGDFGDGKSEVLLDAGKMQFPLEIRARQPGDFFYPLGFGKRKKLQDYFVDEKVPRDERDAVPVVVSGGEIIWVSGYRADERFRATENTKKFLRLVIVRGNF